MNNYRIFGFSTIFEYQMSFNLAEPPMQKDKKTIIGSER